MCFFNQYEIFNITLLLHAKGGPANKIVTKIVHTTWCLEGGVLGPGGGRFEGLWLRGVCPEVRWFGSEDGAQEGAGMGVQYGIGLGVMG